MFTTQDAFVDHIIAPITRMLETLDGCEFHGVPQLVLGEGKQDFSKFVQHVTSAAGNFRLEITYDPLHGNQYQDVRAVIWQETLNDMMGREVLTSEGQVGDFDIGGFVERAAVILTSV